MSDDPNEAQNTNTIVEAVLQSRIMISHRDAMVTKETAETMDNTPENAAEPDRLKGIAAKVIK